MRLVDDWQWVFAKAWSVKFSLLSALFQGAVFIIPMVTPPHPGLGFVLFALAMQILAVLCSLAAAGSRVVAQPKLRDGPP